MSFVFVGDSGAGDLDSIFRVDVIDGENQSVRAGGFGRLVGSTCLCCLCRCGCGGWWGLCSRRSRSCRSFLWETVGPVISIVFDM